nr:MULTISPECIES: PAS domain-containing protein [unclassified Okeania]
MTPLFSRYYLSRRPPKSSGSFSKFYRKCYYSVRWLEMLGYDPDDIPQNVNSWEMLIHPEDKVWVMDALNLHLEDSSFIYAFDYRLQTKSGE